MTETWLPWCLRKEGPTGKTGYAGVSRTALDRKEGEVKHSAEGSADGLLSVLYGPRDASWHFSVLQDGTVWQHYPLEAITWHCGIKGDERFDTSLIGNITLIGVEHEGGGPGRYGEPLTEAQYRATLRLSQDIRRLCSHLGAGRPQLRRNLWEHRWLSWTTCPSDRIPWGRLIEDLIPEEDEMKLLFYKYGTAIYSINQDGKARHVGLAEWKVHKAAGQYVLIEVDDDPAAIPEAG